jgi:hypothetical protein
MKQPVLRDRHFYILLSLFIACAVFYYFGELVILFGWEALRRDIFYKVNDLHRMLFLVPILYLICRCRLGGALMFYQCRHHGRPLETYIPWIRAMTVAIPHNVFYTVNALSGL